MREAQRRNLLFVSATANSRFLVASLLGMTKITLRVRLQTILAAY
jgi:superfamily II helicase